MKPITCVIAGASEVGKTVFLNKHIREEVEDYEETIDDLTGHTEKHQGKAVKVDYLEIGGHIETRRDCLPNAVASASAFLLLYKDQESMNVLEEIWENIDKHAQPGAIRGVLVETSLSNGPAVTVDKAAFQRRGFGFAKVSLDDVSSIDMAFDQLLKAVFPSMPSPASLPRPPKIRERKSDTWSHPKQEEGLFSIRARLSKMEEDLANSQAKVSTLEAQLSEQKALAQQQEIQFKQLEQQAEERFQTYQTELEAKMQSQLQTMMEAMMQEMAVSPPVNTRPRVRAKKSRKSPRHVASLLGRFERRT